MDDKDRSAPVSIVLIPAGSKEKTKMTHLQDAGGTPATKTARRPPARLHHNAFVTSDLAKTRWFYEELVGLPLIATWTEDEFMYGARRIYCHCFFGLQDGGALAFFQFANPADASEFSPAPQTSSFVHLALAVDAATQAGVMDRMRAAGYGPDEVWEMNHGYCQSLYFRDPNGLLIELTLDHPDYETIAAEQRAAARDELERWLAGDHGDNNRYRTLAWPGHAGA
jgi:glyoxylase I family protein